VEKKDIYGDVVNVAQRFEGLAKSGEILLSTETCDLVKEEEDLLVVFSQETHIKGKIGLQKVFKVLWREDEIEHHKNLRRLISELKSQLEGGSIEKEEIIT